MSAAGSSAKRGQGGFTTIELLVVMATIALLAGLATPLYAVVADAVRFRTAARGIAAELREARGIALRTGEPVAIAFDPGGQGYGLAGTARWVSLPGDLALRWTPGPLAGEAGHLAFFPDGSSSGGELWLAGPRHAAGIGVHPLTGAFTTLTGAR
jgi:general secretion pathway protein H